MSSNNTYIITEQQRLKFKPTYLMIKQHSVTGLKYLCKTTKKNPLTYNGSGLRWKKHIKQHGIESIQTVWYKVFYEIDELVSVALTLSELYDIVDSTFWANLKPENGLDGGTTSEKAIERTKLGKNPFSGGKLQSLSNSKLVEENKHNFQGSSMNEYMLANGTHPSQKPNNSSILSAREKEKVVNGTHHFLSKEFSKNQSKKQKEKVVNGTHHLLGGEIQKQAAIKSLANGTHASQIKISCIYCYKCLDVANFKKYHGDKCKHKP
jgi:hypothetical protein